MLHTFYSQLSIATLALCCGFAIWKGGPPERAGALMVIAAWIVTLIASVGSKNLATTAFLVSDGALAAGLLLLAVRYSNWWMGAAMLLQALSLSLHAAYFAQEQSEISMNVLRLYVLGKNMASIAMLLVLLAATIARMFGRSRRKAAAVAGPLATA